jgi:hypothetical protein
VGTISSAHLSPGSAVFDMFTELVIGEVDDLHSFQITLEGHQGMSLFVAEESASDSTA